MAKYFKKILEICNFELILTQIQKESVNLIA